MELIQKYLIEYFNELVELLFDMAPWLLLGFLIAGILHVFFPQGKINSLLGASNMRSVMRAALIGIPLPLCSCGVIPTGVSIHQNGASKGAAVSFLISTPQTGVDSIMVTYSLLGLPFALVRPIAALITGLFGGAITNQLEPVSPSKNTDDLKTNNNSDLKENSIVSVLRYAFVDFLQDIAKWLVIGLFIAALIAVFIPDDFFSQYIQSDVLGMLIILVASIPVYVCATSSVPIAAVLMMKGISPGAALIFLMAGPATNAATISVIGKSMGKKTLISYLATLMIGAMAFGLLIDLFIPREWFTSAISNEHMHHEHGLLPRWLMVSSGVVMVILLLNVFIRKRIKKWLIPAKSSEDSIKTEFNMSEIRVIVKGMNCNHCKMNVENNLKKLEGIENIVADIEQERVTISGEGIDLKKVKEVIENIGYSYKGEG